MIKQPMTISETKEKALKELYALISGIEADKTCVQSVDVLSGIPIREYSFRVFDTIKERVSPKIKG